MTGLDDRDRREVRTSLVLRRMIPFFRPYRRYIVCSLTLILIESGLALSFPLLLRRVIDEAIPRHDVGLLTLLCGTMIGLGLLASAMAVGESALRNWIGQRVVADLRADVYDHASAQPLEFYTSEGEAQIQARLVSDIEGVDRLLTSTAQSVVGAVTSLAVALAAMLILSWPLAVLSFALAVGLSLLNNRFSARRRVLAKERQGHLTTLMEYVAEDLSLAGIVLGRTLGRTSQQRTRFTDINRRVRDVTVRQRITGALALTAIGAAYACVPPGIFFLAGSVLSGVTIGTIVVLVTLQMRLTGPIQSLLLLSGSLQASVAKFERVLDYINLDTVGVEAGIIQPGVHDLWIRDLSYRYPESRWPVVDGVDLDLPAGSVTVIVGPSGSGKSTFGLILAGLLERGSGAIDIPGLENADPAALRAAVTLVPQHTLLFKGTIGDNLRFADADVAAERIADALETVQLDDLVARLPLGLDTPVGEDGHQLSGGERQRLALARALLAPCRVLVLDEATSALDNITAERLYSALRARCRAMTLVVIAHRIPRLESGDHIVVMANGRIAETGTHAELTAYGGAFADLLSAQSARSTSPVPQGGGNGW